MLQKKPLVVLTHELLPGALKSFKGQVRLKVWSKKRKITSDELMRFVRGADGLIVMLTEKIDRGVLEAAGDNLKIVANYAVGFDNIDLAACAEKKVLVTNTPGILTETVAEHTMALMLAVARRVVEADRFVREGRYSHWDPQLFIGHQLYGKKLGIVGLGRIGTYLAQMAFSGFHMEVIYHDLLRDNQFEEMLEARFVELDSLIRQADFISLHVPLLPSTFHLIGKRQFRMMKKSAILINTARGQVVDERALVHAVQDGQIAGAALDVFEREPRLTAGLSRQERIVLTPHIASATESARLQMADMVVKNVLQALRGKKPINLVELPKGEHGKK